MTCVRGFFLLQVILFLILFSACRFEDPRMLTLDSNVAALRFCGPVVELDTYNGAIRVGVLDAPDTMRTTFQAYPNSDIRVDDPRGLLEWRIKKGDSLCREAGSSLVRHQDSGRWREWEIHL
jgi:hypothetical protein